MKFEELINMAGTKELTSAYPKADGLYIWDYKLVKDPTTSDVKLELIPSNSGKLGFKDKVSLQELITYVEKEAPTNVSVNDIPIQGVELVTMGLRE